MNLVIIGAQASGKMTVGQEIERLTDLGLIFTVVIDFNDPADISFL